MFGRVYWGTLLTVGFMVAAVVFAARGEDTLAIVLAVESVAMAVLSLKETQ